MVANNKSKTRTLPSSVVLLMSLMIPLKKGPINMSSCAAQNMPINLCIRDTTVRCDYS